QFARIELPDLESEPLPFQPESLDLVVSALAFQFVNDLPGMLAQIRRALKPDGLLLAAMIGGETLTELRQSFAAAEAECEGGVAQIYGERFADPDGRIRATFDMVWLSGWAPHANQQQPLRPGSAKASLAEAVKKPKV